MNRRRSRERRARRSDGTRGGAAVVGGQPAETLSRESGGEIYRLEQWWEKGLLGIDEAMNDRTGDPLQTELDAAKRHIGELLMENESLRRAWGLHCPLPGEHQAH